MLKTRNDDAMDEKDARHPSKAARTILTAFNQVKIASQRYIGLITFGYLTYPKPDWIPGRRTAIGHGRIGGESVSETALHGPAPSVGII